MELRVNGEVHRLELAPERRLLGVLRDVLGLTGSKYGCGEGQCGACTVLVDGEAVRSCITRVGAVEGREIRTIESLEGGDGTLHPVQQAFLDHDASSAATAPGDGRGGGCPPGRERGPDRRQIVEAMQGNICRCGTYPRIVAAIRQAAESLQDRRCPMSVNPYREVDLELEPERYELHSGADVPFVLDRREFLRALGGGLAVLCLLRGVRTQESGRRGRRGGGEPLPDEIDAWLHIGEDGVDHGLHRQGRGRPERPDLADPGRRRRAARAGRVGDAGHGRHGESPV